MSKDQSQQPPNANPAARGAARMPADPSYSTKPLEMNPGDNTAPPPAAGDAASTALNFLGGAPGGSANPNAAQVLDQRYALYGNNAPGWTPHDPGGPGPSSTASPPTPGTAPAPGPTASGDPVRNVNTSNVPSLVGGDALADQMRAAQDAAYQNATGYLDPQWKNQQDALETKLANQGVMQNSEGWNKAMDDFGRQKQFAYQQAQSNAVTQGNTAQSQLFNQGLLANSNQFSQNLQTGQFSNQVRSQLVAEGFTQQQIDNLEQQHRFDNSLTMRNQDINELLLQQQNPLQMFNLLTSGGNVQTPNFTNTPSSNVNPTDIASIYNQATTQNNNVYNAQTGASNSQTAGIAAIASAALMAF